AYNRDNPGGIRRKPNIPGKPVAERQAAALPPVQERARKVWERSPPVANWQQGLRIYRYPMQQTRLCHVEGRKGYLGRFTWRGDTCCETGLLDLAGLVSYPQRRTR